MAYQQRIGAAATSLPGWQSFRAAAEKLQAGTFVFDFVPLGEPCIATERHRAVMLASLSKGRSVEETLRAMHDDRLRELAEDPACAAAVRASWSASGVDAVLLTLGGREIDQTRWDAIVRDIAYWTARERMGSVAVCLTAKALTRPAAPGENGKIVLGMQDAAALGEEPTRLETLYQAGVRVIQLTYNNRNLLGDGCKEAADAGLSRLGIDLVRQMNALAIAVDTSHCGPRTTLDAIRFSKATVAVTHAFCRSVLDHPRGKTDEVLRALKDTGGYFGLTVIPSFFAKDGQVSLDHLARHVEHACNILGTEHVGIGSDYGWITPDGPTELNAAIRDKFIRHGFAPEDLGSSGSGVEGFHDWADWPNIPALLLSMGLSDGEVSNLIGGNWLRYFARISP